MIVESSWTKTIWSITLELRSKTIKQCFMFILTFIGFYNRLDSLILVSTSSIDPSQVVRLFDNVCINLLSTNWKLYMIFTFSALLPISFLSSPYLIPDKTLISGENSGGNDWNKIARNTSFLRLIPWGHSPGSQLKKLWLRVGGEVKHENLLPNKFIWFKFPP